MEVFMGDRRYTREDCLGVLREKYAELTERGEGRYPQRSDLSQDEVVAIKAFFGPWPRALEAAGIITYERYAVLAVKATYSDYQKLQPVLFKAMAVIDDTEFSDSVTVTFAVKEAAAPSLAEKINEITSGRAEVRSLESRFDYR